MELASDVASGSSDNNHFRTIPPDGTIEAHIQFDFNIDMTLSLMENILMDLGEDILTGRNLSVSIPYSMEGTLFFQAQGGGSALGFGPIDDKWKF